MGLRGILVALLLLPLTARAENEDARAHYERGLAAFALGHFADAAEEYEKAFAMKPDPALLYNAAQAHRLGGNKSRALFLYQNYLRLFAHAPNRDEVQRHVAALKAAIESEKAATNSPPTDPAPVGKPVAPRTEEPKPQPAPATTPVPTPAAAAAPPPEAAPAPTAAPAVSESLTASPPPPAKKKSKAWVIGVAVGVAVVAAGLGIGLGVGLSGGAHDPSPTYGTARLH